MRARYKRYSETVDLTGKDIVSVVWGDRDAARSLFPFLADPADMELRDLSAEELTAVMTGEIADEVHEFLNARQGSTRIRRLLLRGGQVIELALGTTEGRRMRNAWPQLLGLAAGAGLGVAAGAAAGSPTVYLIIGSVVGLALGGAGSLAKRRSHCMPNAMRRIGCSLRGGKDRP